jgi:hypothetical protein
MGLDGPVCNNPVIGLLGKESKMKKRCIILATIWIILGAAGVQAQVTESGDLTAHVDSIIVNMPTTYGGGDYLQPNSASRALWREIVDHILAGEYADAHTKAQTKNYQVVLFTDTADEDSTVHIVLERTTSSTSRYWGTFVFNTSPLRSLLVIQSPHPRYDLNTGYQSIRVYQHTGARGFFVAGTHRCNGLSDSPCDGTTTACSGGSSEPYKYSDQAHVVLSTFQITTDAMLDDQTGMLFIQPHGFSQGEEDPDLIISNGTSFTPSGTDHAVAIRDAIQAIDPTLTAKVGHIDLDWTRLLGTTNCQGRLINSSSDPCEDPAISANGQFVHIEQARIGLRDTEANWMKLAQAVADAVPEDVASVPPAAAAPLSRILGVYPNPFRSSARIDFELDREGSARLDVFDAAGRLVVTLYSGTRPSGVSSRSWDTNGTPSGVYFVHLSHDDVLVDIEKCVLLR